MIDGQKIREEMKYHPTYDPSFLPIYLFVKKYRRLVEKQGAKDKIEYALLRGDEVVATNSLKLLDNGAKTNHLNLMYVERMLKTHLWIYGGNGIRLEGPEYIVQALKTDYSLQGERAFDVSFFEKVFKMPFAVYTRDFKDFSNKRSTVRVNPNSYTYKVGLDLGGSVIKISALVGDTLVYSEKHSWEPKSAKDPDYHFATIVNCIRDALVYLPKIEFLGFSSAGIVLDNSLTESSLFRSVLPELRPRAKSLFQRISRQFGDIPFTIFNDGEVSALAGKLATEDTNLLAMTFGTSQGAGFVDEKGNLKTWINELAFVPVDLSELAIVDEWSLDKGVGVSYFSQDAAIKLARRAKIEFDLGSTPAERFSTLTNLVKDKHKRAQKVFEDMGIYLGYTLPFYYELYGFEKLLLLGGVMAGKHGKIIRKKARDVMKDEFPDLYKKIKYIKWKSIELPAQATTAAQLPILS